MSLGVATTMLDLETSVPFGIARWTHSCFENYVVTLTGADGVSGSGEAAPNRRYAETRADGLALLERLAPEIADLDGPAELEAFGDGLALDAEAAALADGAAPVGVPPWPALRAALSAAAWDLAGRRVGEPVWRMLGLERPAAVTSYTVAIGAPEEMIAQARAASAFGTLKVKLGFDGDLELARSLAQALPETTFRFDANEGWDRERAARAVEALAGLGAELVEQPLPAAAAEDQQWLHERSEVPLFADEAILTLADLDVIGELYDGVVVKLAKAGGIAHAFSLISACRGRGLQVLLGCMVESSLGIAAALQLAGLVDHVDLDGALLLARDPYTGIAIEGDRLTASDEAGLGVRPREA
jgi:L-alanine-DL-glutamate epimerase-like enolase superfamily enzyme